MTEPVIDIRDRIEKMRNQMTVPASKVSSTEIKVDNKGVESVSRSKAANINVENLEQKIDKNKPEAANKENIKFNKKENLAVDSEVQNLKPKKVSSVPGSFELRLVEAADISLETQVSRPTCGVACQLIEPSNPELSCVCL